ANISKNPSHEKLLLEMKTAIDTLIEDWGQYLEKQFCKLRSGGELKKGGSNSKDFKQTIYYVGNLIRCLTGAKEIFSFSFESSLVKWRKLYLKTTKEIFEIEKKKFLQELDNFKNLSSFEYSRSGVSSTQINGIEKSIANLRLLFEAIQELSLFPLTG